MTVLEAKDQLRATRELAALNTITLHRGAHSWFARFAGPDAVRIQELFGTCDICTGFTNATDGAEVLRTIARLNPEYTVTLETI